MAALLTHTTMPDAMSTALSISTAKTANDPDKIAAANLHPSSTCTEQKEPGFLKALFANFIWVLYKKQQQMYI